MMADGRTLTAPAAWDRVATDRPQISIQRRRMPAPGASAPPEVAGVPLIAVMTSPAWSFASTAGLLGDDELDGKPGRVLGATQSGAIVDVRLRVVAVAIEEDALAA